MFIAAIQLDLLIQVLQNKAARIVTHSPLMGVSRNYIYDQLNWLTVNQLIQYHTLLTIYKIRRDKDPEFLYDILSDTNIRGNIVIRNENLTLTRNSFTIRGPETWNLIPTDIRNEPSLQKFKSKLKKWITKSIPRFV